MRIIVFGIHPDDVELGCGGTIARSSRDGHQVTIVDLTRGESSSNGTPEERAAEAEEAARILGCEARVNLGFPDAGVRSEDGNQQAAIVDTVRSVRPHLVLLPNGDDPHPDHASGAALIERALYLCGIHGYPGLEGHGAWKPGRALVYSGRREVRPDIVVDITPVFDAKTRAILAHQTQFGAGDGQRSTPLNDPEFLQMVEARDRTSGWSIGVRYGEAFATVDPIPVEDLSTLLGDEGND